MAVAGWILDKSAAARVDLAEVRSELRELTGTLYICPVGELEQRYSARSPAEYDELAVELSATFPRAEVPPMSSIVRSPCSETWHTTTACGAAPQSPTC